MKKLLALTVLLLVSVVSLGTLLPTQPPVCTATPPAQAVAAGYTKLVVCNTLQNGLAGVVDVNNTTNPWYLFYMTAFGVTVPSNYVTQGGSGIVLTSPSGAGASAIFSINVTPTGYNGNTITGGFYVEIDSQFNSAICETSPSLWPAPLWMNYADGTTGHNFDGKEFVEFDIFEWLNCVARMGVIDWININPQTHICTNSNATVSVSPGTGFNTYGGLFIPANGGTGSFSHYFNNTLENMVTFSASAVPNPAGTCPSGAFSSADTQPWMFSIQGGTINATTERNLHIWQAP